MSNILEVSRISKDYGNFRLQDVSFSLPKGYIMGLIGPNGAGKTTIIKMIMNLVMKQSGEIKIFDKDHQKFEVEIKKRIGFVYDTPTQYEHLNLKQFKNTVAPFYENWDESTFKDLVSRFNLPLNKKLKKFSKGMAMKGSIAIALSHNADFIIMDEPTSSLDPVVRRELLDFLRELIQDENKSILFSSHITTDIEQVADFITYVHDGKVIFSKTKDDVFEQYAIIKGGNDLLDDETRKSFVGDRVLTERIFEKKVLYEKASLEDIMFYTNLELKKSL
jgi:ABC-2 type transport system ATP-binding protein